MAFAAYYDGTDAFGMDREQKAMFGMLPLLWPFIDFPDTAWEVHEGCYAMTSFMALCVVGYICQNFLPFVKGRFTRYLCFFAPTLRKGELWRLFTYFLLHSDLQHLLMNMFHLMNVLDVESVPDMDVVPGMPLRCTPYGTSRVCYPHVGIGFEHTLALIAVTLAFGALVGTIRSFGAIVEGASSVCFGVDGALLALYGMFLGAGLDHQARIPEFGAFFRMRIGYIAIHIGFDLLQGCSGRSTVGTTAHMASLVAGFCYVLLALPPMGDGSLFRNDHPYLMNCALVSPAYMSMDSQCVAFFKRSNGIEVGTAQSIAALVLGGGVLASALNAYSKRHISDDGFACCS